MKSANEIKARIKSIKETSQITKAMKMISISKMRKALVKYEANRSFNNILKKSIIEIFAHHEKTEHPYLLKREGKRTAYIVITSDKGFAGDFNHKIIELAYKDMQEVREKYIFTIGRMSYDYFANKGIKIDMDFIHITNNPTLDDARKLMYDVLDLYDKELLDEVKIVYTRVLSNSSHEAVIEKLLPLSEDYFIKEKAKEENKSLKEAQELEFNGKYREVINIVIKQHILGTIYSALIQSIAAEHYSRMVAMDNATRNSKEMLIRLNLEFNKLRQEKITTEICETSVFLLKKE